MHNYDFAALSDYEFEQLSGDLLQAELSLTLERFSRGRDSGIDLRISFTTISTDIFQCKHYLRSGYSKLLSTIKSEIYKVRRLNPRRYFLITSVDLTPKNKDELIGLLAPYCQLPSQIFGAGDLNNLLVKFPHIEKIHFKLWLSSVPVLEKILHSRIISESESEINRIQDRISKYVVCGQFPLAIDLLKKTNVCIVSGPPGVGKTTLAEIVLAHFLKDGYTCIKIPLDISDARELFRPEEKQIFYYDDFLGKTSLYEKLGKNEDDRIVRFIKDIQKTKASKFILTTREYILRQAQGFFEGFRHASIDLFKLVLEVTKYSTFEKAKILYNHLYFSSLPRRALYEMASPENYKSVILHKNYNPRIIEFMTDIYNLENLEARSFSRQFIENLDHPTMIWVTAFKKHIGPSAQNLLLSLLTLPNPVSAEDLETAFTTFHNARAKKYNQTISPYDFRDSLRELDGSFIRTDKCRNHLLVRFHNPSVMDFLENHLKENPQDVIDLSEGLYYPDQISGLYSICEKIGLQGSNKPNYEIMKRLKESFLRKSVRLIRHTGKYIQNEYWDYYPVSKEDRLFVLMLYAPKDFITNYVAEVISIIELYQRQEEFLGDDLFDLIVKVEEIIPTHPFFNERFLPWAKKKLIELSNTSNDLRDFKGLCSFYERYQSLNPDEIEAVKCRVEKFVYDEISYIEEERPIASEIEDRISDLKSISDAFQMDFNDEFESAIDSARDPEYPEDNDHDYGRGNLSSDDCSDKEISVMFETLIKE